MSGRRSHIIFGCLLAAAVLARLAHLTADGPTEFPNGLVSYGPVEDEAAKSLAARSLVLFGSASPSPADDYRFWEVLAPAWTYSLFVWFKCFGTGTVALRLHSVFWFAVSMIVLYGAMAGRSRPGALAAAVWFGFNFYILVFSRLGLIETELNALLIIAFAFQVKAMEKPAWYIGAAVAWGLAYLVKQSAALYFPVLAAGAAAIGLNRGFSRRERLFAAGCLAASLGLALGLLWWDDYRIRTIINFRHIMDYKPDPTYRWMNVKPDRTLTAAAQNLTVLFVKGYVLMAPVAGLLALAEIGLIARDLVRRRTVGPVALLAAVWWLSTRAALTMQGQALPRFYLAQLPSVMVLAGLAVERLLGGRSDRKKMRRAVVVVGLLVAASLAYDLTEWGSWVKKDPRDFYEAGQELGRMIGDRDAVLVGKYAAPFGYASGRPYKYYYLKNVFNRLPEQFRAFGITHLLVATDMETGPDRDPALRRFEKFAPAALARRREVGRIVLWPGESRERTVVVYEIDPGLIR